MNLLVLTSLYPNEIKPNFGIFVENRLRHLLQDSDIKVKVIAPVPWFPFKHKIFGNYAEFAKVPKQEIRYNIEIYHPRYIVIPKIGMNLAPFLFLLPLFFYIKKIIKSGFDFQILDAHFFYPDGVAAVWLAHRFRRKIVISARGSDITLYSKFFFPRCLIRWAVNHCDAVITVCKSLQTSIEQMQVKQKKITTIRNGVDLTIFKPEVNRIQLRKQLDIKGFTLLSVGHLIALKGHDLIIKALQQLPGVNLIIVGSGPLQRNLVQLTKNCQVESRVTFTGNISHTDLQPYYAAADCLVLASSREGWANVLLESMACGTPVIATKVGGTSEVVTCHDVGILLPNRSTQEIISAVIHIQQQYPNRKTVREYAENYSWSAVCKQQLALYESVLE